MIFCIVRKFLYSLLYEISDSFEGIMELRDYCICGTIKLELLRDFVFVVNYLMGCQLF